MFLSKLFHRTPKVECPRCLGKGFVDLADIERLDRKFKWLPGPCAYCSGKGKVPEDRPEKVPVNTTFLATNLPASELKRLFNGDVNALNRAKEYEKHLDDLILEIRRLHFVEGWDRGKMLDYYFSKYAASLNNEYHKNEFSNFINLVLTG